MSAVICSRELLRATIRLLQRGGERGEERVALWLSACHTGVVALVIEVYEPDQIADIDFFRLPPASMRALMDHLRATRRRIVAQIHTHPGKAFHSYADAQWAIVRHAGALSLVLPHFAERTTPENFLSEVMTYQYSTDGFWDHRPNEGDNAVITVVA